MTVKTALATVSMLAWCGVLSAQGPSSSTPAPEVPTTAASIPGVVSADTKVQRIWTGQDSADGIAGALDGTLLFTEQNASRVSRMDMEGRVTTVVENTNGAGALAVDAKGRIIAIERLKPRVEVLTPTRMVLAQVIDGEPIERLSDLVVDKKGGLYVTGGRSGKSEILYIRADGSVVVATDAIDRANGVMLSPDESVLYTTSPPADVVFAFDVREDGSLTNQRQFARLDGGTKASADGLAIDAEGRLYVATLMGIQVFSPEAEYLGTIPTPRETTTLAFAGPDKKTLYVVGRGNDGPGGAEQWARTIYMVEMQAQGFKGRAK